MKKAFLFILTAVLFLVFCSCKFGNKKIRLGGVPSIDVLPLVVADSDGIFKQDELNVEIIFFNSAPERDSAFISGTLDGVSTDPVDFFLIVKNGIDAKIICETYHTNTDSVMFGIMAAPYTGTPTIRFSGNEQIAISWGTIFEFLLDQIMASESISPDKITKLEVKALPVRYQMLISGSIKFALLPEPLVSKAVKDGAFLIADDRELDAIVSMIIINNSFLEKNSSVIKRFISSYNKAVAALNSNPGKFKDIMVTKLRLPSNIRETFKVPVFREAALPAEKDILAIYYWMKKNGMISIPIDYKKLTWQK
jgi:NitT/TauT family transport system substrate-binding protein